MPKWLARIVALIVMLAGIGLLAYPWVSNKLSEHYMGKALDSYDSTLARVDTSQLTDEIERAKIYDDNLIGQPVHDPFDADAGYVLPEDYQRVLNIAGDGVMGSIRIPKINVELPIYHGTSEESLRRGVGHIEYSSTPYGGEGRHSWLSAHRGLPGALLFTDLDKVKIGDSFFIDVLGEVHAYRVTTIDVVDPDGLDSTRPTPGQDLVTLVTCTPYGVNTQRLLVTGERYPYSEQAEQQNQAVKLNPSDMRTWYLIFFIAALVILVAVIVYFTRLNRKAKPKRALNETKAAGV